MRPEGCGQDRHVKEWLSLPMNTCDGPLYAKKAWGGLGVPKLKEPITAMQVRKLHKLSTSSHPVTRVIMNKCYGVERYKEMWALAGGQREKTWGKPSPGYDPEAL